ncbi:MAG TPA: hypothetical protein VL094_06285 [Sphingomonadaceae bacterium]|nr:hypothetical protein [Sphingomonadaceae bacterium]
MVAQKFFDKWRKDGNSRWAPATAAKYDYLFALLKPSLGNVPVKDITPVEVLAAVRKVEAKGTFESAQRALQMASSVFRYAVATGRLEADHTRDLRGALIVPETKHRPPFLTQQRLESCCKRSTATTAASLPSLRLPSPHTCSSDPVSFAKHNGKNWT